MPENSRRDPRRSPRRRRKAGTIERAMRTRTERQPGEAPTWAEIVRRQINESPSGRLPLWSSVIALGGLLLAVSAAWVWRVVGALLLSAGLFSAVQNTRRVHGDIPWEKMRTGEAACLAGLLSSLLLAGYGAVHGLRTLEFALGLAGTVVTVFVLLFFLILRKTGGRAQEERDTED